MDSYDYIVIGGGSAGCVVTSRLVAAGKSVLLIESGPADNTPFIHIPATFLKVLGTRRTWAYRTEPEPGAFGRRINVPQGRTLGGGSSVNAMIYIRGQAEDYNGWRDQGCLGWGWEDVLPYFRRSEANQRLAGPLHGTDGPLKVSDNPHRHPLSYAFVRAGQEIGLPFTDDFNGASQGGVGFYQTTTFRNRRGSSAATYLAAVRSSPLLTVRTESHVECVLFENGAAAGARFRGNDGGIHEARAREEVVVSAGGVASPKILQLSGIGPGALLAEHGIHQLRDLPGVGANFQDHICASVYGQTRHPISLLGHDKGLRALRHGVQYALFRNGLLASNIIESGGFIDTSGCGRPDVQIHVTPTLVGDADRAPPPGHGITINPCILRPTSRGTVSIRSREPADPAIIVGNNLTTREDVDTLIRGVKLARRILRAPSMAAIVEKELAPGPAPDLDDEALENHVRRFAKTVFHPSGTCRMGTDAGAVVAPDLRVHGVPRLRVADASIMPAVISGNTNAPSIMIGERCADFLLGRAAG